MKKILIPVLFLCIISLMGGCKESEEEKNVTINFDADGGGEISSVTIPYDSALDPVKAEKEGYSFQGWFLDKGFTKKFDFEKPLKDQFDYQESVTLYAKFSQKLYRIIYDGNGNTEGEVPVDDNLYAEDDVIWPLKWGTNMKKNGYWLGAWELIGEVKSVERVGEVPYPSVNGSLPLIRRPYWYRITIGTNDITLKAKYNNEF